MGRPYVAEASARTKAPLEAASRAIVDAHSYPKWFKGAHDVVVEGYPAVGGLLTWKIRWARTSSTFQGRVVENDLPRRLVMRVKTPSGESDVIQSFERDGQGTRYTKRVEVEGGWFKRFLMSLFLQRSVKEEAEAACRMADESA